MQPTTMHRLMHTWQVCCINTCLTLHSSCSLCLHVSRMQRPLQFFGISRLAERWLDEE